jgi:hypothetical protein
VQCSISSTFNRTTCHQDRYHGKPGGITHFRCTGCAILRLNSYLVRPRTGRAGSGGEVPAIAGDLIQGTSDPLRRYGTLLIASFDKESTLGLDTPPALDLREPNMMSERPLRAHVMTLSYHVNKVGKLRFGIGIIYSLKSLDRQPGRLISSSNASLQTLMGFPLQL